MPANGYHKRGPFSHQLIFGVQAQNRRERQCLSLANKDVRCLRLSSLPLRAKSTERRRLEESQWQVGAKANDPGLADAADAMRWSSHERSVRRGTCSLGALEPWRKLSVMVVFVYNIGAGIVASE